MRKILSCEFNLDTACVELRLADGTLLSMGALLLSGTIIAYGFQVVKHFSTISM